ncbi:hypothetical protein DQ04_01251120 [Trypanosoma grayi]|uniref:hypothetical protein n=1 Tax=Trypanosoma grayi TaxID=71804 RepID=UPI0004F4AB9A|nr:hypothetical protein DQ04_01251120 [Trypanosoma grayi]KEG13039.1 hypothetical protein DQ04_01251120 [Trypanosoma grayi]
MRRVLPWRVVSLGLARRFNSDSLLDDIFSELSVCDITQRPSQSKAQTAASSKGRVVGSSSGAAGPMETSAPAEEEAELRAELSKQEQLLRQVQEAMEQAAMAEKEEVKAEEVRRHARYTASPPAALHLSTAELIQEKSPQHFTPAKDSSARLSALPRLESPGSVAVVTLVGRVLSEVTAHGEEEEEYSKGTKDSSVSEDGPHARFLVQYSVPFLPSSRPVKVQVRCYGATLASFSEKHVKPGDLVHILGHLLPLESNSADDPVFCVCALPVGGNISVVLSAKREAAAP